MASSNKIEYNVCLDIKAALDAKSIANVIIETARQPEAAVFVRVACVALRSNLESGSVPTGMRQADIVVDCYSYEHDDATGSALAGLVESVRDAIYDTAILTTLNTKSTYNTYYGLGGGDDLPDEQERYRIRSLIFSLVLKPEKA